jgi:hypothetical protein
MNHLPLIPENSISAISISFFIQGNDCNLKAPLVSTTRNIFPKIYNYRGDTSGIYGTSVNDAGSKFGIGVAGISDTGGQQ